MIRRTTIGRTFVSRQRPPTVRTPSSVQRPPSPLSAPKPSPAVSYRPGPKGTFGPQHAPRPSISRIPKRR